MGMALATTALGAMAQAAPQAAVAAAEPADERFEIKRFQIDGNTLLTAQQIEQAVGPFTGAGRVYGDIQQALEALENAYRQDGYSTVLVHVPEQELTSGVVRLQVTEAAIGKVTVVDNKHFSEANIRASIPALQPGMAPNMRKISESLQLANDNPAKQASVELSNAEAEGKIDAKVTVTDNDPFRVILTLDNTGSPETGQWRTGVALQHSNLFNRDQVGTLAYTTSPDSPSGSKVDLYSLGYRLPLYGIGDSVDFIYGKSNVTSGTSPTLGSLFGFTGKGDVYALRWNHFFARSGEWTSKLVLGADYKKLGSTCSFAGIELSTCQPYSTLPLSATYSAQRQSVGQILDYNVGIARNWAVGRSYTSTSGRTDRYSFIAGNRDTTDNFVIARGGVSLLKAFASDWQMRLAGTAQYAPDPLAPAEQFGLAGSTAVRGFSERAVAADSGMIVNAEAYTPELLAKSELKGNLRLLAFYDIGRGYNNKTAGSALASSMTVASLGFGARYNVGRDFNLRLDVARVSIAGTSPTEKRGDLNAHLSATLGF
ncbi:MULTISPECIES: ShlB/FhaC/HecB family hemolysin secretion/activation protein [unclassified Herbaspirillum]|nr:MULTISPECIES: ShlB/FhaC/HecB family hemolysin secretion/activation protein [unclassified Herbaspirillum]MBB5392718.1 hemolysin activation/secretion protein [Herbaspirillum sp. SJZ102]TQJ99109.1 hemolysin activation/secretion protein [Herbaspirillum sp. SJZ130]TQK04122.1 hemolysin activation/secretion protein [Herbaspirillum sp. SJZ106]